MGSVFIFCAMQTMQFIRVSGHTVKNFIYPQCVVQFYAHKKTATAAGRLRFFVFFIRAISDGRAFGGLCRTCLSMKFYTSP